VCLDAQENSDARMDMGWPPSFCHRGVFGRWGQWACIDRVGRIFIARRGGGSQQERRPASAVAASRYLYSYVTAQFAITNQEYLCCKEDWRMCSKVSPDCPILGAKADTFWSSMSRSAKVQ